MIEILGSKVSFFTLYGLISLQLMAIVAATVAYKGRAKIVEGFPVVLVPALIFGFFSEMILLMWMGSL